MEATKKITALEDASARAIERLIRERDTAVALAEALADKLRRRGLSRCLDCWAEYQVHGARS